MTKYKVLKEMVGLSGCLFKPGHIFANGNELTEDDQAFYAGLLQNFFIEEVKDEPWKPKDLDEYWYILEDGGYGRDSYSEKCIEDAERLAFGNCFQTKEQVGKTVEWLKAFKVLRDDTKGFKSDWKNPYQYKFSVFYDYTDKYLGIMKHCNTQAELIFFATEADARESIEKHKKEWLTFFGVEDK